MSNRELTYGNNAMYFYMNFHSMNPGRKTF